jgi:N-acetylmuramoyl-L-alanine amidase
VFALREHLRQLGHRFGSERDFGERTEAALLEFQTGRGLRADGICGPQTWAALQEAGWALGDRIIALRRPNLRGDDVAALQQRLSALGFDPGRPDGIFGPESEQALREFQLNAGIASDGVCGPATITALDRLDALAAGSVAEVREHETLSDAPRTVHGRRVTLVVAGHGPDVATPTAELLVARGAEVEVVHDDVTTAARLANDFGSDLVLGLFDAEVEGCTLTYFGNARFRSVAGHTHATRIGEELARLEVIANRCPRTSALLRETRMAAVGLHLGERDLTRDIERVAAAIAAGIVRGFEEPPVQPA